MGATRTPDETLAAAPGAERREPPLSSPTYAVRAPLARWLREEARAAAERHGRYRLLDVGCGVQPYRPFFESDVREYVGVDAVENPSADVVAPVEDLPFPDGSFELVLCNQVLEHAEDPARAVRELHRVTAPGGRVLASTHGTQVYHPSPGDFWRWTHAGLQRLFSANGSWAELRVEAGPGTAATLAMLLSIYAELATKRTPLAGAGRATVAVLNRAGAALDRRSARLRDPRQPGALIGNFHVTAVAAG